MDTLLLVARLVLAATFLLAGVTKLIDLAGSKKAMRDFGLPISIADVAGIALPVAELVVAVLLLPVATAWSGALGALVLLAAFLAGIGYNLAQGRTPDCHCFGQVHSEPIGPATIARNGVLAVLAAMVLIGGWNDPGPSVVGWWRDLATAGRVGTVAAVVAFVALAVEAWFMLQLLQQNGRLLLRLEALESGVANGEAPNPASPAAGLPVGSAAPEFSLPDLDGETVSLTALRAAGKPVMVLFTDPGCGPCTALMPEVAQWRRDHAGAFTMALVSRGSRDANLARAEAHGLGRMLLQEQREVAARYRMEGTPAAVLVRPNGTIGSSPAFGADAIRALVTMTTTQPALAHQNGGVPSRPAGLAIGTPAPELSLPDLTGTTRTLSDHAGSPVLVLFWNPGCGFCNRMLDDLKAWEATAGPEAPKVLVVSRGTVEANEALGLRSTVVLDQDFATGRAFGSGGTPSAVLIDADGKVAAGVAVGAAAVFALANQGAPAAPAS